MAEYLNKATDGVFLDLVEDKQFRKDLVAFFTGGRYNYTEKDYNEKGIEGFAEDFVEHMRGHDWNEVTAAKDLNYAKNKDVDVSGKQAFGRLIQAWDSSDKAGTNNFLTSSGDFFEAIATAPSSYLALGSLGLGKLASKAGAKGLQILTRKELKKQLSKEIRPSILKSAGIGAAEGVVVGTTQSVLGGETREELIEGYEYTNADVAIDAAFNLALGVTLGAGGGKLASLKQKKVDELFLERSRNLNEKTKKELRKSFYTLKRASKNKTLLKNATDRVVDIEAVIAAKKGDKTAKILNPLDPDKVKRGGEILKLISKEDASGRLDSGLSIETLRSVTAATIDIVEKLGVKDNERISSKVTEALRSGDPEILSDLDKIRNNYGLTKEEMSLVYLSEFSQAGKVLAEASIISRAQRSAEYVASKEAFKKNAMDLKELAEHGVSSISDQRAAELSQEVIRNSAKRTVGGKLLDFTRDLDAMRISFMTSQPATTARNVTSTAILAGVDLVDEFFRGLYTGKTFSNPGDVIRNMTSTLGGMTYNQAHARVLKDMFMKEMPETYASVFNDAMRLEVGVGSNSAMAQAGRLVNVFNTATDTFFKEGMFFSSLDRQLRNSGRSVEDLIKSGASLDSLPEGMVRKAYDDANRFTMQRSYVDDKSPFAKTARFAIDVNRKVPFFVSGAMGIPFPRYVANHLEMVADYTPFMGLILRKLGSDPIKTDEDRVVRQMTGFSMAAAGYVLASMKDGEVDYKSIKTSLEAEADIAPSAGFVLAHLYMGDLAYRGMKGMPLPKAREIGTVLGGVTDFSADFTFIEELVNSGKEGRFTEGFQKSLGNVVSTFTYPGIIAKDLAGQVDYDAAGTPFIRNVEGEMPGSDATDISLKGEKVDLTTLIAQSTRFAIDLKGVQYLQSFNGETDIDYFSPFNPAAIGKINPVLKQITGLAQNPPLTEIEKEMNRLALEPFDLYKTYSQKNATVDFLMRRDLSQNLHKEFIDWKQKIPLGGLAKGRTYDQLGDDFNLKSEFFKTWVGDRIKESKKEQMENLTSYMSSKTTKHKARGFIRNNYEIKKNELGNTIFNVAAEELSRGRVKTSKAFLASSESILDELNRRQAILSTVETIEDTKDD